MDKPYIAALVTSVISGEYPLHDFYIFISIRNQGAHPTLGKEFLKLMFSKQGQQSVVKDRYIALPDDVVVKALKAIY